MPPSPPTPLSASNARFSLHHPMKFMTLRPNTWLALETLVEFAVVSYLIWALFYFVYLWICGTVWTAKGLRDILESRRGGRKWRQSRRIGEVEENAADANEGRSVPAYEETRDKSVEDGLNKKSLKSTVTYGDDTGSGRRATV